MWQFAAMKIGISFWNWSLPIACTCFHFDKFCAPLASRNKDVYKHQWIEIDWKIFVHIIFSWSLSIGWLVGRSVGWSVRLKSRLSHKNFINTTPIWWADIISQERTAHHISTTLFSLTLSCSAATAAAAVAAAKVDPNLIYC